MKIIPLLAGLLVSGACAAQTFVRSELPTQLSSPWEITYGPDGYLWVSELPGRVSRVDPVSGAKTVVYTAPDYFPGDASERGTLCFQPVIGAGTLGLTLHPNFLAPTTAFIYYVYSYNAGSAAAPRTRFKVVRLLWNNASGQVTPTDLITDLPTGYDHLGGRLLAAEQGGVPYLFLSLGDNGLSESNDPDCYASQADNPNNLTQDLAYRNGKIHRFNMDGTIPATNPIPGNSFYTRGHRNPQGLIYNPVQQVLYNTEHGDRTDDEINVLEKGKNYGWKQVRGYHDGNQPGEAAFVSAYVPDPRIAGDALKEPLFAWCTTPPPTGINNLAWCTTAPSDGAYYGSSAIPEWTNSLLVVTLKDGVDTDQEVYQFKLDASGTGLAPSTMSSPNPQRFFGADQAVNGRLRDIAVSPDGLRIFLVNNGNVADKITVYTYSSVNATAAGKPRVPELAVFPNPAHDYVEVRAAEALARVELYNVLGTRVAVDASGAVRLRIADLPGGAYVVRVLTASGRSGTRRFVKS